MLTITVNIAGFLIFEGDISGSSDMFDGEAFIGISDGTVVGAYESEKGIWRLSVLASGQNSNVVWKSYENRVNDGEQDIRSDKVRIDSMAAITHVVVGADLFQPFIQTS